ncbi:ribonuclease H-like domain-containing protein [Scheffersomyces coipomensis]|uniref:ribonuclease H-like domain-containing protein n=1 Tax=Scheffersomyces coipomensis TaxID=1788519 RepID=UPI00315D7D05
MYEKPVGVINVYIDGSCRGNGTSNARAGYGIYYQRHHPNNASIPLDKVDNLHLNRPTNQRAELFALRHALRDARKFAKQDVEVRIYTDSMYVKNCMEVWIHKWSKNNWKNVKGETVANKQLIQEVYRTYASICKGYSIRHWNRFQIIHVAGHSGNDGNDAADELANRACEECGTY